MRDFGVLYGIPAETVPSKNRTDRARFPKRTVSSRISKGISKSLKIEKIAAFAKNGFAGITQSFVNLVFSAEPDFRKEPFLPGFQKVYQNPLGLKKCGFHEDWICGHFRLLRDFVILFGNRAQTVPPNGSTHDMTWSGKRPRRYWDIFGKGRFFPEFEKNTKIPSG